MHVSLLLPFSIASWHLPLRVHVLALIMQVNELIKQKLFSNQCHRVRKDKSYVVQPQKRI